MWNDKKSLILSKCCVVFFFAALIFCAVFAPRIADWLTYHTSMYSGILFLITIYVGCIPAAVLLIGLYMLLHRIGKGVLFVRQNVDCMRCISWCCFIGAIICFASSFYYLPWIAVAVAAVFVGLIVRVVKNIFAKAVALADDAELTI